MEEAGRIIINSVCTRTRNPKTDDPVNLETQAVIVSNNYYVYIGIH